MLVLDVGSMKNAYQVMEKCKTITWLLAVSLGFYKTLFSAPGASIFRNTQEEQNEMGISEGIFVCLLV